MRCDGDLGLRFVFCSIVYTVAFLCSAAKLLRSHALLSHIQVATSQRNGDLGAQLAVEHLARPAHPAGRHLGSAAETEGVGARRQGDGMERKPESCTASERWATGLICKILWEEILLTYTHI